EARSEAVLGGRDEHLSLDHPRRCRPDRRVRQIALARSGERRQPEVRAEPQRRELPGVAQRRGGRPRTEPAPQPDLRRGAERAAVAHPGGAAQALGSRTRTRTGAAAIGELEQLAERDDPEATGRERGDEEPDSWRDDV